jgi:hypothetical protein
MIRQRDPRFFRPLRANEILKSSGSSGAGFAFAPRYSISRFHRNEKREPSPAPGRIA